MAIDSIVAEVRQAREALAQRFNYDLRAMIEDARQRQAASGRKVVSFPPKPARQETALPGSRTPTAPATHGEGAPSVTPDASALP